MIATKINPWFMEQKLYEKWQGGDINCETHARGEEVCLWVVPGHISWGIEESTNIDIMSIIGDVIFHKSFVT